MIIRINGFIMREEACKVVADIHTQAATGVIVLPNFCELLNEVPADEEICVKYADGAPLFCSGCKYWELYRRFSETLPNFVYPQTLLCPHHIDDRYGPIFCVNWPPVREVSLT